MWESSSRTIRVKKWPFPLTKGNHSQNFISRCEIEKKLFLLRQVLWQEQSTDTPSTEGSNLTTGGWQYSCSLSHQLIFLLVEHRDIWHTYLPNRKQAAVAAHCLRAAEPEVSKTLKQRNHHNNCWLMNMRTKQQAKDWFVTVSKGAPEMQWVLHTQQAPGFVLKARNPGQTTQMFWWKSWWERVKSMEYYFLRYFAT